MIEGKLNNTTVFSGITWVDEVITVVLLLASFIVYKLVRYKCYPTPPPAPVPVPVADAPPAQAPPTAPAQLPPHAPQAYQQYYAPPSYSSPFSAQLLADTAAATAVKYAKKPKVNVIESESEDESSGSDTTSVVTVPAPVIEKKRKNRPRTRKNHLVTDKENTTA